MRKCPCGELLAIGIRQGRPRRYCSSACRKRAWRERRAVPRKMRATPRWVRWTLEHRGDKLTKVPRRLNGRHASVSDPRSWTTFRAARSSRIGEGIGWVLGEGIGCLDLDEAIEGGMVKPWAAEIVERHRREALMIEVSHSGRGIHIFLPMKPGAGRRIRDGRNIEIYPPDSGRYIAVTGWMLGPTERPRRAARALMPCGTSAAARRHRRRGEPVCDRCMAEERALRVERGDGQGRLTVDRVRELRYLLSTVRQAIKRASSRDRGPLAAQEEALQQRIEQLTRERRAQRRKMAPRRWQPPGAVDELAGVRHEEAYMHD